MMGNTGRIDRRQRPAEGRRQKTEEKSRASDRLWRRVLCPLPSALSPSMIALMVVLLSAAGGARAGVGDPMTDFSLQDLQGVTHTLQDYQDRVLVLFFMGHN